MIRKNNKEVGFVYKSILPNAYQQVEYIESTGTQYINTGIKPDYTKYAYGWDFKIKFNSTFQYMGSNANMLIKYNDNYGIGVAGSLDGVSFNTETDYEIKLKLAKSGARTGTINGINSVGTNASSSDYALILFGLNTSNGAQYRFSAKVYYSELYSDGNLIQKLVPCYRKSDNVVGMYDTVTKTFFTNQGTGTFNKGNDIDNIDNIDKVYKGIDLVFEQGFTREENGEPPITTEYQAIGKDLKNYEVYGNTNQGVLPNEYQEVEYIESTGTQYINLGYKLYNFTDFELKLATTEENPSVLRRIFGGYNGSQASTTRWELALLNATSSKRIFINYYDTTVYSSYVPTVNEPFVIKKIGTNLIVPNQTLTLSSATFNNNVDAYLFASNRAGTSNFVGRIYYMKIFEGDVLRTSLVPCYRKSDNVVGMYDTVSKTFYTNAGTGTFTKGNDIVPTPETNIEIKSVGDFYNPNGVPNDYCEVEYIESTGTQYIDLGLKATEKSKISITFSVELIQNLWRLFGARTGAHNKAFIGGKYGTTTNLVYAQFDTVTPTIIQDKGIASNVKCNVQLSKNGLYVDGTQTRVYPNYTSFTTDANILLFGSNDAGSLVKSETGIRIYETQFWEDNVLVRNMIPCYRKSDGVIGMYDLVNSTFYTNAGTGTFNKGNNASKYKIPIIVKQPNYNIMSSAEAGTKTNNNVTFTCDGKGTYTYTGSGESEVFFDLKESFVIPTSVGQGGTGTISLFNSVQNNYARIKFYADNTMIDSWLFSWANRKSTTYGAQGNRICNRVSLSTDSGFSGTVTIHPYFTNTGQYPDIAYVPEETDIYLDEPLRKIGNEKAVILPNEYQQVEFIESTGTQWIDTGVLGEAYAIIDCQGTEITTSSQIVLGTYTSSPSYFAQFGSTGKWGISSQVYGALTDIDYTTRAKFEINFSKTNAYIKANGVTYIYDAPQVFVDTETFALFRAKGRAVTNYYYANAKIYSVSFIQNGTLIRNMIPCYRKSDSVIGMYDTVNNVFYTNEGTGTFTKGSDVYVDYIDFKNSKIIRKIGKTEYDGSSDENWVSEPLPSRNMMNFNIPIGSFMAFPGLDIICNRGQANTTISNPGDVYISSSYVNYGPTCDQSYTLQAFKTWLSNNNLVIIAPLDTPTEESITLPSIPSFKDTCIYEVDTDVIPSDMYIKYKSK